MAEIESVQKQLTDMQQKLGGDHPAAARSIDDVLKRISEVLKGKNDDGLAEANTGLNAALRVVEGGDRTPPIQALELYSESSAGVKAGTKSWKQLKAGVLSELNAQLRRERLQEVQISEIESEVYELMTR
jgi:hypothetical protein